MNLHTQNCNAKLPVLIASGGQSRTARKFTSRFGEDSLPHAISCTLDWLSFIIECSMPEPPDGSPPIIMDKDLVFELKPIGNSVFKYGYTVYQHGETVANLFTHPRNEKIMPPGSGKLEVLNHVLYSTTWFQVVSDICNVTKVTGMKISRLDIAIDGANHIYRFLNAYLMQGKRQFAELKTLGRWDKEQRVRMLGRAKIAGKEFSKATGFFESFKIGSSKKSISIYNKSREIQDHSHKEYIRDAWRRAGMNAADTHYRVELRLDGGSVKQIADLQIAKLIDPNYLLQMFKTHCRKFFEFVKMNDSNVTRGTIIDLFQFEKLKVPLLEKIPRAIVRGAYKARLAIHNAFANVRLGMFRTEQGVQNALGHISDLVDLYNLREFFERKKPAWLELYPQPVRFYGESQSNFYL